jgi:hypothetical protein
MTLRIAGGLLASAVLCAIGCGSNAGAPVERVGTSVNEIQGGSTDTTHNFAVGVCGGAFGGPDEGANCQLLCSGALIAPNLVISARHCVDNVSSDKVDCATDSFGSPLFPANQYFITTAPEFGPGATWYQVAQIVTPTLTNQTVTPTPTDFCNNDLSLLILSSNVPSSEVPVLAIPEIWNPIYDSIYSSSETAIGYGQDSVNDTDSAGVRRILENISIVCVPGDPESDLACPPVAESGIGSDEFEAANGPCEGDSGSSAYEQSNFDRGTFLSLGVLSRGGASGDTCEGSTYTQLYPWQSLIIATAQEAAAMGGYPAPPWTTGPPEGSAPAQNPVNPDAGKLPFGSACESNGACASDQCVSRSSDGGYICSQACSSGAACPAGFACFMDYCFASGTEAEASSSPSTGGGCEMGHAEPFGAQGWAFASGLGVLLARRRRVRSGHGPRR